MFCNFYLIKNYYIEVNIDANQKNIRKNMPFKFIQLEIELNKKETPTNETTIKKLFYQRLKLSNN